MNDYDLFDTVNTTAVSWLTYNRNLHKKPLGIKNFNSKNTFHLWLLRMINVCSISNNYENFYLDCNFIEYLIVRFWKGFKYARINNGNALLIEADIFIKEVCEACKVDPNVIKKIYEEYWTK